MVTFGNKLAELRAGKKVSQQQLADILQMSRSTYAQYEIDRREPDFDMLKKLATYFNVSIDYLLGTSPFKDLDTADTSITIAALKGLLYASDEFERDKNLCAFFASTLPYLKECKDRGSYPEEVLLEIDNNLDKIDEHRLSDLDYYNLARFSCSEIQWPTNYEGPTIITLRNGDKIPVPLDYWEISIVKFTRSPSDPSKVTLVQSYSRVSLGVDALNVGTNDIHSHGSDDEEWSEEELSEIEKFKEYLRSKRTR